MQYVSVFGWKKSIPESIDEILIKTRPGYDLAEAKSRIYFWGRSVQSAATGVTEVSFDLCAGVAYGVVAFGSALGHFEIFELKASVCREWRSGSLLCEPQTPGPLISVFEPFGSEGNDKGH